MVNPTDVAVELRRRRRTGAERQPVTKSTVRRKLRHHRVKVKRKLHHYMEKE